MTNPVETYINAVNRHLKTNLTNLPLESVLTPTLFSNKYIAKLTTKDVDVYDALSIFMKFIDLDNKTIYREFHKYSTEETKRNYLEQVVTTFLENPYKINKILKLKLYVDTLDKIYTKITGSFDPNNKMRVDYLLKKVFRMEGYIEDMAVFKMIQSHGITDPYVDELIIYHSNQRHMTYKEFYGYEKYIVETINTLLTDDQRVYKVDLEGIQLDKHQIEVLHGVMNSNISIITGGPGTGKSTLIGSILDKHPKGLVLAPTGCAVENIQTKFPRHKLSCFTIHSFYYRAADFKSECHDITSEKLATFMCSQEKLIIIDEFSMVDVFILTKLFTVLKKYLFQIKFIFVGDPQQLPSIKMGQLLLDFINSGKIPTFLLSKCYRSNDGIIKVLAHIKEKNRLGVVKDSVTLFNRDELFKMTGDPYKYFVDFDHVIISPTNEEVNNINKEIQSYNKDIELCAHRYGSFKRGDKLVFLKNERKSELFNGTLLILQSVKKTANLTKGYDNVHMIFLDKQQQIKEFDCSTDDLYRYVKLCYAITVHKVQGHEHSEIYLSFTRFPRIMHDKKLIYTALSRAKNVAYVCGDIEGIQHACGVNKEKISSIPDLFKKSEPKIELLK
jgi:exodeoxyribonuclease V alpha subunit